MLFVDFYIQMLQIGCSTQTILLETPKLSHCIPSLSSPPPRFLSISCRAGSRKPPQNSLMFCGVKTVGEEHILLPHQRLLQPLTQCARQTLFVS